MIWFSCKQCGKTHSRPESSVGATIFCSCGAGIRVPWESTATEPIAALPASDALAALQPPALQLDPLTFAPAPSKAEQPARANKWNQVIPRDSQFCFNHQDLARHATCADCGESFCEQCLVTLGGAARCGPCKNFHVKNLQRSVPPAKWGMVSVLIVFLTTPVIIGRLPGAQFGFLWLATVAFLPQALAGALAILAMRQAESDPKSSGRSLAFSGLFGAGLTTGLIVLLAIYSPHRWT